VLLALDGLRHRVLSLSYLKRFPIRCSKIDRSFIANLTTDEDDAGIVTAVLVWGKNLHMRVVGRGRGNTRTTCNPAGVRLSAGQGYYFSNRAGGGIRPLTETR